MRISVVTPAWNAAATIADTVRSVLAQTHRDLRLVIVDDGSTDDTAAVVAGFADPRLRVIRQANAGVSAARNRGIAAAEGEALLFLDADDWLAATALARLAATLHTVPQAVAAVGAYARVDAAEAALPPRRSHLPPDLLPSLLVRNLFANCGQLLIRATAVRRAGRFVPGLVYGEDWEFLIRLALLGRFACVAAAEPVLFVRSRADGAYRRLAADPASFAPCMAAIFANPDLLSRFGPRRLAALRRRTEAENAWIIGREHVRQGQGPEGRRWLRRSVATTPSLRRLALLAMAQVAPVLPRNWRGPFQSYSAP